MGSVLLSTPIIAPTNLDRHQILRNFCHESVRKGLRTLRAESFVGHDEATRTYSVSLHILEIAYGVLRRGGLMDLARLLMHSVFDAQGVSVYQKPSFSDLLVPISWSGSKRRGSRASLSITARCFRASRNSRCPLPPAWELVLIITAAGHSPGSRS